jgi:hypothetical protein
MSAQIFVSYRREDSSGIAGRLSDRLTQRFPGMTFSPALHPLDIFRPAKVKTILRLVEPLGLGGGLAGLATSQFCAIALSLSTIRAGNKELSAMEALA